MEKNEYGNVLWQGRKCIFGMPISFTKYIVTDTKLYVRTGLLGIKEDQLDLYRVVDFSLIIPLGQRIFSCGTVVMHSMDRSTPKQFLKAIKEPRKVLNIIDENVRMQREKYGINGMDMIGSLN